jgi:hypothetical protein
MGSEEDTYTSIFNALRHPIRRRILRMLEEKPSTYTEVLNGLGIDNGLLNYHLDSLRELVTKGGDDRYTLSDYGRATLSINRRIEDPPETDMRKSWAASPVVKALLVVLLVASVASAVLYVDLSGKYSILAADHEAQGRRLTALEDSFSHLAGAQGLVNVTLKAPSYTGAIGVHVVSGYYMDSSQTLKTVVKGEKNYTDYVLEGRGIVFFYSPEDGLTLEVTAFLLTFGGKSIPLTVQSGSPFEPQTEKMPLVWSEELSDYGFYRVTLPSAGWYTINTQGPITARPPNSYSLMNPPRFEYNLKIQLRVTSDGSPMLFAVRPLSS